MSVAPADAGAERLDRALAAVDEANAEDPTTLRWQGADAPLALVQGRLADAWVQRLSPAADDVQRLAARAHHLRRWAVPRDSYPEGRAGYLRWRADQKRRHAEESGAILEACGYGHDVVDEVGVLLRKEGLRGADDPTSAVQVHEDALCLVFLQTQLDETLERLGHDRLVPVLVKTLDKMSEAGIAAAGDLELSDDGAAALADAVAEQGRAG